MSSVPPENGQLHGWSAAASIAFLTDVSTYAQLFGNYGWPFDCAEAWILDTLIRLLFPDT